MKILIVGSNSGYALERIYQTHLADLDHEVDLYPITNIANIKIRKSILLQILRKLKVPVIYKKENQQLFHFIKEKRPDIIWIFKGIEILPNTLKKIKSLGIKLVNYNPDHPFIRSFSAGGGKNIEQCVPFYDLHFCYSLNLCELIKQKYKIPTVHLPFGYELSHDEYEKSFLEPEILKVSFVGNPDSHRKKIIQYLASHKISIDVYGYGWNKFLTSNKYITINNGVEKNDFWNALRKYRISLNIFRPHNEGSHNMRTFEIPAVGGIMLAPKSKEHNIFFEERKEFFAYTDFDSLIENCNQILNLSQNDAAKIRKNARNKSVREFYNYKNRASIVSEVFEEHIH